MTLLKKSLNRKLKAAIKCCSTNLVLLLKVVQNDIKQWTKWTKAKWHIENEISRKDDEIEELENGVTYVDATHVMTGIKIEPFTVQTVFERKE